MKDEVRLLFKEMNAKIKTYGVRHGRQVTLEIRKLCDHIDKLEQERELKVNTGKVAPEFSDKLQHQLEQTFGHNGKGRLTPRDKEIMRKIGSHLLFGFHPLTHCTDLVTLADLCSTMATVYPDDEFFAPAANPYEVDVVSRRLGPLIPRSNATLFNKTGSWYVPVDPDMPPGPGNKPTSRKRTIWVLRSAHKYVNMGPADLFREYERQYDQAKARFRVMKEGWETNQLDLGAEDYTWCNYSNSFERLSAQKISNIRHAKLEEAPSFL